MRYLLDTHVLLWALTDDARLDPEARSRIDGAEVFVSAASIWELSIKVALGKLHCDPRQVLAALEPTGFSMLPVTGEHAAAVCELPMHHRDPFDRLLIIQARHERMLLLTADRTLDAYGRDIELV